MPVRSAVTSPVLKSLFALWAVLFVMPVEAKSPGSVYCFKGVCHRVKTLAQTEELVGKKITLNASHYASCRHDRFNPCGLTSSGEPFRANLPDNAASPDLPDGTILLLYYRATGNAAVVRVNNAGPYWGNRRLDVSKATARSLGFARKGVAELEATVLRAPRGREAHYRRYRRYRAVPGFIGQHASLEDAYASLMQMASKSDGGKAGRKKSRRALETLPILELEPARRVIPEADPVAADTMTAGPISMRPLMVQLKSVPETRSQGQAANPHAKVKKPGRIFEHPPELMVALHGADEFKKLPLPADIQKLEKADPEALRNRRPHDDAEPSFDGYASNYTLRSAKDSAPTLVAWNAEQTIFGTVANWASDAQAKARLRLASASDHQLTPRQNALNKQSETALGGTFEKFASVVAGVMKYATYTARAHVKQAARQLPPPAGAISEFKTSELSQGIAKSY